MFRVKMLLRIVAGVFFILLPLRVDISEAQSTPVLSPAERTVVEGEDANFTCAPVISVGSPVLNTLSPGETESSIAPNDRVSSVRIDQDGDGNNDGIVYTWLAATREDDGVEFFCQVGGDMSNLATLSVNYGATIVLTGGNEFTIMDGNALNVPFSVDGRPTPSLRLTKDGIEFDTSDGLTSDGFSIPSVEVADAGEYILTATNDVNSTTASFEVIVRFAPIFEASGESVSLSLGGSATIDCSANAVPEVQVQDIKLTINGQDKVLDENNMYTITNATGKDAGDYVCSAMNAVGPATLTTVVEVGAVPGTVSNIEAQVSKDDDDVIVIQWDAASENGVDITQYNVVVQYKEKVVENVTMTTSISVTREELDIPKEEVEVVLSVSVTAVNGIGEGQEVKKEITVMLPAIADGAGSTSTLCQALLSVLLMMSCTTLMLS